MTGLMYALKRFAVHDGPGIRTTLFLKGCPLSCLWCHNPEGKSFTPQIALYKHKCINCLKCASLCKNNGHQFNDTHTLLRDNCVFCSSCEAACFNNAIEIFGKKITVEDALNLVLEDRLFYESSLGGVTISGGEPLMQKDFVKALLIKLKEQNIHVCVDTCGYADKTAFEQVAPYTDLFLYDIKAFSEETHIKCTGKSNKIIWENLEFLDSINKPVIIRFPFIPSFNDFEADDIAKKLSTFKNILSVDVLPYHNFSSSKYEALDLEDTMPKIPMPQKRETEKIKEIFRKYNLKVND
jgi:pyruvate formate lyase activating enzyme